MVGHFKILKGPTGPGLLALAMIVLLKSNPLNGDNKIWCVVHGISLCLADVSLL